MQLTGSTCAACGEKIVFQDDGTWCGDCKAPFHKQCEPASQCPACKNQFLQPDRFFVRSSYCPDCMTPNIYDEPKCRICSASTQWDTEDDYGERRREIHRAANKMIFWGMIELGL